MKQCTKCLNIKNFSDFHKKASTKDGYANWCKVCVREYDLKEHDSKRVYPRKESNGLIHCRSCEQYLDKSKFSGTLSYCKDCSKFLGHKNNIKRFNITPDEYIDMLKAQNNVCKICNGTDYKRLAIDHDHSCCNGQFSCGKCIRGLICSRCNKTLGMVNDDKNLLQKMIDYI